MRPTRPLRMPILPKSSYYDDRYRQSPALIRARQPYLVKNIFTGLGLFAFAIGVYSYTFYAVQQDDFSDIPMPAPPTQNAGTPNTSINRPADPQSTKQ